MRTNKDNELKMQKFVDYKFAATKKDKEDEKKYTKPIPHK